MIDIFLKLINNQALDEWNERTIAVFILVLVLDWFRRLFGRAKFRFELTNIAKNWVKHKEERAISNGDSNTSNVKTNPHPKLGTLLEEIADEVHELRGDVDDGFRNVRKEMDDGLRELKREVRKELDEEVKMLRSRFDRE